jgi:hypothetical protein
MANSDSRFARRLECQHVGDTSAAQSRNDPGGPSSDMTRLRVVLLVAALALLCDPVAALYSKKDTVVQLDPSNWDDEIGSSNEYWIVEFYAPWCVAIILGFRQGQESWGNWEEHTGAPASKTAGSEASKAQGCASMVLRAGMEFRRGAHRRGARRARR